MRASGGQVLLDIREIPVGSIRPERALSRVRDESGHRELRRSIERFGVLTPITVRQVSAAPDRYVLVKGQGRTLASRMLSLETIPAIVVEGRITRTEKVQQFLVENVSRLRMSPVDRALLIVSARRSGEETKVVAERFGVSASTVRRLEQQIGNATHTEIRALQNGDLSLSLQSVISRFIPSQERGEAIEALKGMEIRAARLEQAFLAVGWPRIVALGDEQRSERLAFLAWLVKRIQDSSRPRDALLRLAREMPFQLSGGERQEAV